MQLLDDTTFQSSSNQLQLDEKYFFLYNLIFAHKINNFRDELISNLQRDVNTERKSKEHLISEARTRIEQYESRLIQMKNEMDTQKLAAETAQNVLQALQLQINGNSNKAENDQELEQKIIEKEQKFMKLKSIYDNLRKEHIDVYYNSLLKLEMFKSRDFVINFSLLFISF